MLNLESREPRRLPAGERMSDAPQRFLESVRYCSFDRTLEFRKPAELRVTVRAVKSDDCASVRAVRETDLEHAIAQSLSDAADEEYRVRVTDKNYGPSTAPIGAMRLTLIVGRA